MRNQHLKDHQLIDPVVQEQKRLHEEDGLKEESQQNSRQAKVSRFVKFSHEYVFIELFDSVLEDYCCQTSQTPQETNDHTPQ